MIGAGTGEPFAPAGKRLKKWTVIPGRDEAHWEALTDEAVAFATDD